MLAVTETLDCGFVGGIDARWKPPMPLMARISPASGGRWLLTTGSAAGIVCAVGGDERQLRAAVPAGVGLRVEAAVERVVVFGLAGGAHFEARHGGLRAVVGNAAGDGVARAAVGAVEKGIAIAAVGGREQFAQAIGAGGGVGGNSCRDAAEDFAGDDAEARFTGGRDSRTVTASMRESGGASERRRVRKVSTMRRDLRFRWSLRRCRCRWSRRDVLRVARR